MGHVVVAHETAKNLCQASLVGGDNRHVRAAVQQQQRRLGVDRETQRAPSVLGHGVEVRAEEQELVGDRGTGIRPKGSCFHEGCPAPSACLVDIGSLAHDLPDELGCRSPPRRARQDRVAVLVDVQDVRPTAQQCLKDRRTCLAPKRHREHQGCHIVGIPHAHAGVVAQQRRCHLGVPAPCRAPQGCAPRRCPTEGQRQGHVADTAIQIRSLLCKLSDCLCPRRRNASKLACRFAQGVCQRRRIRSEAANASGEREGHPK
mmetsp:Transcript_84059/g.271741  ORF Transcript_84059/g.271741 Transcript_84059/m.271741 type:complete len:260 (-) Transcript_84059:120-899(-)